MTWEGFWWLEEAEEIWRESGGGWEGRGGWLLI